MSAPLPSGIYNPSFLSREFRPKNVFITTIWMLVCMLTMHTGVSAFNNGTSPGVPDMTHSNTIVTIVKDNSVANAIDLNILKAHVVDSDGNPVAGVAVTFLSPSGSSYVGTTDANGDALYPFGNINIGPQSITVSVNGTPFSNANPIITTFVAGPPSASAPATRLTVLINNSKANGIAKNVVRATIVDAQGHPIANQSVTFTIFSGTGSIVGSATATTDASGNAVVSIISTVAGQVKITATVNGINIVNGSPATVTFVADVPSVSNPATTLSVVTDNATANGVATNSVKAHVVDANGNPVPNATVVFTIVSGTGTIVGTGAMTTDVNGDAVITLNSTVAGEVSIIGTVNGITIINGSPAKVTFVADAPAATNPATALSVVTNYAKANGTATNTVKAHIVDANGNPVKNATVVFSIISGTGTFVGTTTVITDANGDAVISLTSTVSGFVKISATVNGVLIVNGRPATVYFTPDVAVVTNPATALIVVTNNAVANGIATNSVKAHVVDANGNPTPYNTVKFTIISGTGTIVGSATVTTDANGDAVITLTSTVAGDVSITATVNGLTIVNGSPAVVTFVADMPSVTNPATALSVLTNNALANGTATNSVKVHIVDANGNPVPNATIVFTITSGTGTFVGTSTVTTDASGNAVISIKSTVAGDVKISATVNGITIINGNPATVTFVVDVPSVTNPATALSVVADNAIANGTATNSVKAHIVDATGNPVPNATIVFTITSGTGTIVGTGTVTTNASGDAIITITSTVVGSVDIKATVNGTPIVNGSPATVHFVVDVPNTTNPATALTVITTGALADGVATNSVKAHIVDASGHPVPNATIVFNIFSGTGAFVGTGTVTTNASGDAIINITSTVVGPVEITATVNGTPITNGSPAKVIFVVDVPSVTNPATALSVIKDNALADGTSTNSVKAHIVDASGNPVPGATIVFTITSGTGTIVGTGTVTTDANGDAIITLTSGTVGAVDIKATVNGTPIVNGSAATVHFILDNPNTTNPATALTVVTTGAVANGTATNSVKAHIVDGSGHPVPNASVVFNIFSGTGTLVGTGTVVTDANGDAVITLTSTVAGDVEITATVGGAAIVNGSPAKVTFVADVPNTTNPGTALIVIKDNALADGTSANSVKAHIVDANGNPVPNATIIFTITSGTGTITGTGTVTTDANGDAIITLTSGTVGDVVITATVNGTPIINGSPATVHFVVGTPSVTNPATALTVVTDNAIANDVSTNSVKAHIVDAAGHPVPNATIVFTITNGTGTIVGTGTVTTDANGDAVIEIHSKVAGKVDITATVNGIAIINGSPAIVTFKPDIPSTTNPATALIVVVDNALANGIATNTVKAHIVDANGNPVPNATVEFIVASGTATIVGTATVTTDANGDAIITLTNTAVGASGITATVNGSPIVNGSPATVTFVIEPDVANPETELIVISNNALADGVATNSVKAHVVAAAGVPMAMQEVYFKIESGNATVLTVQPVLTDANGDATILLASTSPGTVIVTAKVVDKPIIHGSPANLRFVPLDIYVPKVFTPNGDGKNDVVKPIIVGITTFYYFSVYNRWGNLLFTTKDANVGWDGRYKGVLQPVETYLWIAEGLDNNKNKVTRRGMISLVR